MREQLARRLGELRAERQAGLRMRAELEARLAELQQTLLRIGGAIQVLEELLGNEPQSAGGAELSSDEPAPGDRPEGDRRGSESAKPADLAS
jgi:hypothetical protein